MPTVILLDVSLSMCRVVQNKSHNNDHNSSAELLEAKQLANVGIGTLLDYLAQNAQLEYAALIVFSSLWEIKFPFTRHHESIKNGIYDLELYDKSNVVNAIRGALSMKLNEWTQNGPINIILITDGQQHHQSMNNSTKQNQSSNINESGDVEMTATDEDDSLGGLNFEGPAIECDREFHDIPLSELEGQFDFPCKIQVVCLASPSEPALKYSIPFYKSLISTVDASITDIPVITGSNTKNFKQSALWLPKPETTEITIESVEKLFHRIAEMHYKPYHTFLSCGHLSSSVMLSPKPTECLLEPLKNEFDDLKCEQSLQKEAEETYVKAINKARLYKLTDKIQICGFMPPSEIASPSAISRHLVLPIVNSSFNETTKAEQILSHDSMNSHQRMSTIASPDLQPNKMIKVNKTFLTEDLAGKIINRQPVTSTSGLQIDEPDITKQPSFCVLLHHALKQENMIAICIIGKSEESNEEWFGILHSHTDSKKKSSLMLSLLIPGSTPVLWLPNFKTLGSAMLDEDLPQALRDRLSTSSRGPLKSYSSNNVIWLDPESVQADVQKIIRHAKRSPDKAPHFYKELNRIRRAAISYGFYDVLFGLAEILEREKRVMLLDSSKSVNQETLKHIDHVVDCLRSGLTQDSFAANINPPLP